MTKPDYITQEMIDFLKNRYGNPYLANIWDAVSELKSRFPNIDTNQSRNIFNYWQITFYQEIT